MKAIIQLDVPDWQIGQEVTVYFKDTMMKKSICEKDTVADEIMDRETIRAFNQATYYFRSHEAENKQFQKYADAMDKMFETADKKEQETRNICTEKHCRIFACEKCGYGIHDIFLVNEKDYSIGPIYCPNCGRKVKLDA